MEGHRDDREGHLENAHKGRGAIASPVGNAHLGSRQLQTARWDGHLTAPVPWSLAPLGGRFSRRDSLSIPVGDGREPLTLTVNGITKELRGTSGLASVPTGSTLLSALWPDEHAIFDFRDFRVAVGLLAQQGVRIVDPESTARLPDPNWDEYRWFRQLVKHEAVRLDLPSPSPQCLERALYVASDFKPARSAVGMSFRQLGTAILEQWP